MSESIRGRAGLFAMLDRLIEEHEIVIDRPQGTAHPWYPDFIYPVDYGYLRGTASMDGGGIDVWLGESGERALSALLVIVDSLKKDSEIKLLLGCTEREIEEIYRVQNEQGMCAMLIRREG